MRIITPQHILDGKAVRQANRLKGDVRQLPRIAGQNTQAITPPSQLTYQLYRAFGSDRTQRQLALVFQQPRMLGRRHIHRQRGEVSENVVLRRNVQGLTNRRKIMHGHRQGAVHVEHPVLNV
ncbi:Uncharacterised protein [Mycobacterium tuberculosis]|nr:Uncharacterised protein [Mycobacterium tuberculosis]